MNSEDLYENYFSLIAIFYDETRFCTWIAKTCFNIWFLKSSYQCSGSPRCQLHIIHCNCVSFSMPVNIVENQQYK